MNNMAASVPDDIAELEPRDRKRNLEENRVCSLGEATKCRNRVQGH